MKKLLTIVAVALLLCLGLSAAVAATYYGDLTLEKVQAMLKDSASTYDLGNSEVISDLVLVDPTMAELKALNHGQNVEAHFKGKSAQTGYYVTTAITVTKSAHDPYIVEEKFNNCEEGGYRIWGCRIEGCSWSKTENLPAKPHVFVETDTATCLKPGHITEKCNICGKEKLDALGNPVYKKDADNKVIETKALGHLVDASAKKWTYKADIACNADTQRLKDGTVYVVCTRCKNNIKKDETTYDTAKADRTADVAPIAIDQASDTLKQAEIRKYLPKWSIKDAHKWHKTAYKKFGPTCTLNGGETFYCDICGLTIDEYDKNQPALGHNFTIYDDKPCKYIDTTMPPSDVLWWSCTRCGKRMDTLVSEVDVAQHKDGFGNVIGVTITAEIEGKIYNTTVDHAYQETGSSKMTATLDGDTYTAYSEAQIATYPQKLKEAFCAGKVIKQAKCVVCGETTELAYPLGHDWKDWELDMEAGDGVMVYKRKCGRCSDTQVKTATGTPCADDAHDWVVEDPTKLKCKDLNANTNFVCTKCGLNKPGEYPIADHIWKEIAVIKAATCTEAGSHVVQCQNPGCKAYETQEIPALGHKLTLVEEVPATCKATGTAAYYVCDVCGLKFSDAEGKTKIKAPAKIAKTEDHVWDDGVVTVEPTVEKVGEKTFTCTVCGTTKTEEIAKKPAPAEYKIVDVKYSGSVVSGKLTHGEGALADKISIRVTFFTAGNNYMTTKATIYADGTFEAEGAGAVEAITLVAYATDKVVNPSDVATQTKLDAVEYIVK